MDITQSTACFHQDPIQSDRRCHAYDVFIDLSAVDLDRDALNLHIERLARDGGLVGVDGCVTLALSGDTAPPAVYPGFNVDVARSRSAMAALARAILRAAASRRHLVVLFGALVPGNEVFSLLIDAFDRDPLFGTAQPRFADSETDRIWPLPGPENQGLVTPRITRAVLPLLSVGVITPELLAACLAIRWEVLAGVDSIDQAYASPQGALAQLLCQARRRGQRNFVLNKAVVASPLPYCTLYPVLPCADLDRLRAAYPETAQAELEVSRLTQRRLEPLLATVHPPREKHPHLLLDCRGIVPIHNGTARCALGLLDGFAALNSRWRIDILVSTQAAAFHRLAERYPNFQQQYDSASGDYAAAVLLNQPWSIGTVAELHKHSLMVGFNVLDTISWDILYSANTELQTVWRFIARHADVLFYISDFTRERFNARFPVSEEVRECVMHLSFAQEEHVDQKARTEPLSDHILVIGNDYDHKDLRPTLQLLTDGFPFRRVVAVGLAEVSAPNVEAIPSGKINNGHLHTLIATARVVVFPSYYEGFGLPVLEALAYGRPVVVRSSPLWAEIAAWSRLPGQLVQFDDPASLIEAVGRLLAGLPCQVLPAGVKLKDHESVKCWRDCAQGMIQVLNDCLRSADGKHWQIREEALSVARL